MSVEKGPGRAHPGKQAVRVQAEAAKLGVLSGAVQAAEISSIVAKGRARVRISGVPGTASRSRHRSIIRLICAPRIGPTAAGRQTSMRTLQAVS
ncbi:hypothetical protein GCM10023190_01590 [Enteractinococcus fodinae]